MENWKKDFKWLELRHFIKDRFHKNELPDLQAILFVIGIQELGLNKVSFTKEEKQDLMHIAVCSLLSQKGYYNYLGKDQDGWPHFERSNNLEEMSLENQETMLKECIIEYFSTLNEFVN